MCNDGIRVQLLYATLTVKQQTTVRAQCDVIIRDKMAANTGGGSYGCSVKEMMELMELRGSEAVETLTRKYDGVQGLCQRLKTDPINGMHSDYKIV